MNCPKSLNRRSEVLAAADSDLDDVTRAEMDSAGVDQRIAPEKYREESLPSDRAESRK